MTKRSTLLILSILVLGSCSSVKKLETTAPFSLGETYAQKWTIEDEPEKKGYEVIISVLSLENEEAVLKNLYHNGKMTSLEIKLTEMGNVAVAEFGSDEIETNTSSLDSTEIEVEPFPFELTGTQAVISYVNNEKVKYYRIEGIRRNLPVSYATARAKKEH